jgi:outer membrane receptor protein involved in Fe transport
MRENFNLRKAKRIILTGFLSLLIAVAYANKPEAPIGEKGIVKGRIYDQSSQEPIEYATVALYNAQDSSVVTGTVSDANGHFKLADISDGEFYAVVSFIGYSSQSYDNIFVKSGRKVFDIGNILLEPASETIGEVEVTAQRRAIDYRIDKKVITVGKQMTVASLSAVEVLENVPSVRVDLEGNVSLRGSTGFTVLVDGKPSILDPSDALRQIPASTIDNIEIITNPSVKYRPDGTAGIINVITKKNRTSGTQGLFNANVGSYGQMGGDFLINWRQNKTNFFVGADYNKRAFPGSELTERTTFRNDSAFFLRSEGEAERSYSSSGFRAGFDWDATDMDALSLGVRYGDRNYESNTQLNYLEWSVPGTGITSYQSFDDSKRGGDYLSLTGTYKHQFERKDQELMAQVDYSYRNGDDTSLNQLLTPEGSISDGKLSTEKGPSHRTEFRLDYTHPFSEAQKLETGFQGRLSDSQDQTALFQYNAESGDYELQADFSNNTKYIRNIYSLYGLYAATRGNFGYQFGLRGEYTYRDITTLKANETFNINRMDYFPTLHLSYEITDDHQVMGSYTRRIDRSRGHYLEPFLTWQDAYNVRKGNPDLLPEYIDSYELAYINEIHKVQLSLEGYYRVTHNKVERIRSAYTESVFLHTYDNVGKDYSLGSELMLSAVPVKWWEMDLMGNLYHYKVEGQLYGDDFSRTSLNWSSRFNNTFKLHKNVQFQVNSSYNSATVTAQGKFEGYYTINTALRADFLKRTLSAVLQARDVFQTAKHEGTSSGPDFYYFNSHTRKSPFVSLTLSYRLNNYKPARRSPRNGNDGGMGEEDF